MKKKILGFILVLISLLGCKDEPRKSANPELNIHNETPQALNDESNYKIGLSKRNPQDIITRLYNEAINKNPKLEKFNKEVTAFTKSKNDSLRPYLKYSRTNAAYWNSVGVLINQLQDTTLRKSTHKVFKSLEARYKAQMIDYQNKLDIIDKRSITLNDQLIMMKLLITEPMMMNYQRNEKPDIETMEGIIKEYDRLIKGTDEFTKIKK